MKKNLVLLCVVMLLTSCVSNKFKYNNHLDLGYIVKLYQDNGFKIKTARKLIIPSVIAAEDGYSFGVGNRELCFYKFNSENLKGLEVLKRIQKKGEIHIMAIPYKAIVNGSFVMWSYEGHEQEEQIINIFKKFNLDVVNVKK